MYIKNNCAQRTTDGGDKRDRTADLLNAIQALSQLSYTPKYMKNSQLERSCSFPVENSKTKANAALPSEHEK